MVARVPPPRHRPELLKIVGARTSLELAGLVIPPVLLWSVPEGQPAGFLWAWAIAYWTASAFTVLMRRSFRRDVDALAPEAFERRWAPRLEATGMVFGTLWGLLAWASVPVGRFEFALVSYLVLVGATASAAMFASADLRVFGVFIVACWATAASAIPLAFPLHWHTVLPLGLLYAVLVWRHARTSNGFLVQQAEMKHRSDALALAQQEARHAADAASAAKSRFLARASHDLRQPLYALWLTAQAALRRNHDDALRPLLDDLSHGARHVNELLDALLDLSSIEADADATKLVAVPLAPLLRDLHRRFAAEAEERGLAWRLRLPPAPAVGLADPVLLRRAVANLLHNALRYTRQGGVLLACRRRAGGWSIEVIDTGIGIAPEQQQRIFAERYRADSASDVGSEGHGLGLAVVAECALRLNAALSVASRVGRGSRFGLLLAAGEDVSARDETAEPPERPSGAMLSGRVLVVEDDPAVARALAYTLADWGIEARIVAGGEAARAEVAGGFVPAVVICDLRLADGESGYEVLGRLLLDELPSARGCIVSGEVSHPDLQRAQDEGFIVLRKPVAAGQLQMVLAGWLAC